MGLPHVLLTLIQARFAATVTFVTPGHNENVTRLMTDGTSKKQRGAVSIRK
jgi:hypothetical protein